MTVTYYDESGDLLDSATDSYMWKYTIKVLRLIDGYSANSISVSKISTAANINVVPPQNGQQSTIPLDGTYTITCTDEDEVEWSTPAMWYNTHQIWIQNSISNAIPFMADRIEVQDARTFSYKQNGVGINIIMSGINADVAQCTI